MPRVINGNLTSHSIIVTPENVQTIMDTVTEKYGSPSWNVDHLKDNMECHLADIGESTVLFMTINEPENNYLITFNDVPYHGPSHDDLGHTDLETFLEVIRTSTDTLQ